MKKYITIILLLCGSTVSIVLGVFYYNNIVRPKFLLPYKKLNFSLLNTDNQLVDFSKISFQGDVKIFYLPDNLSRETQEKIVKLVQVSRLKNKQWNEFFLVSRFDVDTTRNLKRLSGFTGAVLLDPSASLWHKIHNQQPQKGENKWTSVLLDKQKNILKVNISDAPMVEWVKE